jgi:preprotein translocase subunit SecG
MVIIITVVHVLVSLGLILVVLLQTGKGAEMGAVFGGSSSTIFGSSGAGNFLTKLTTGMAIVFMITSLTLGYFAARKPTGTIFDSQSPIVEPRIPEKPMQTGEPQKAPVGGAQPTAPAAPQGAAPQKSTTP